MMTPTSGNTGRNQLKVTKARTREQVVQRLYPEIAAGGYARRDGFVDFFVRLRSLLTPESVVLDFGAGRGAWNDPTTPSIFRDVRDLRTKAKTVIGVDVDPVVLENESLDEAYQIEPAGRLPFEEESFDLVLADHVFEHVSVDDAQAVATELGRVLKPGGWICARTPNRWGLIGVAARAVPNRMHVATLRRLQPGRPAEDVFPTRYAMNTQRDLGRLFPEPRWSVVTYGHPGVQQYAGSSITAWRTAGMVDRITPARLAPVLMVFILKQGE